MKRFILLALCLVFSMPAHADQYVLRRFIPGQENLSADVGIVLAYNPGATVTREGDTPATLAERSKIYQGDTIETDGSGSLVIGFIDGTRLSIDPDSKITIQFHNSGTRGVWSILKGLYAFVSGAIAKSGDDAMVINTPVGTIGVRGTAGIIDLFKGVPGGMRVILLPDPDGKVGRITVTNDSGTRTIDNAYDTILVPGADVGPDDGGPTTPGAINSEYGEVIYNLEQQIGTDSDLTPDPNIDDTQTGDITLPDITDQELGVAVAMQRPFGPLQLTPRAVAPISVSATPPAGDPDVTASYCLGSTAASCDGTWTSSPGYARTGQYLWLMATSPTQLEGGVTVVVARVGQRNLVWRIRTRDFVPDAISFPESDVVAMQSAESAAVTLSGITGSLTASVSDPSEVGGMTRLNVLRAGAGGAWNAYIPPVTVGLGDTIQIMAQGRSYEDTGRPITLELTAGNQAVLSPAPVWSLRTVSALTAETLVPTAFSPATEATGVAPHASLVMTFNRPVAAGTGFIRIKKGSGEIRTIDIAGGQATTSGNTATIALSSPLPGNTTYTIVMDDGVFKATDNPDIIFPAAAATPSNPMPAWTFSTYNALPSFCANGNLTLPTTDWSSNPGYLLDTLAGLGGQVTMRQEEGSPTHRALAPSVLRNGTAIEASDNMLVENGDSIKLLLTNPPPFSETATSNSIKIGDCAIVWPVRRLLTPQFSQKLPDATAMNLPASPELSLDFIIPPEFELAFVEAKDIHLEKIGGDATTNVPLVYLPQEESLTDQEQVKFPGKLIPKWPLEPDSYYRVILPAGAFTATFNAGEIVVDSAPVSGDAWKIKTGTFQTGWISIPATVPVADAFSIMKYEAKHGSNNLPFSSARGMPWTYLSLEAAQTACANLGDGFHLVRESEWLAIAHMIKNNPEHNKLDNTFKYGSSGPAEAVSDNLPDMTGTNTVHSRILTLPDGNNIWDFAGGVKEWSQCNATTAQGCTSDGTLASLIHYLALAWGDYSWLNPILPPNGYFYYDDGATPIPPDSPLNPGIAAGTDGLGKVIYSYPFYPPKGFLRGGDGSDASHSGAFMLETASPNAVQTNIGFRCAGPAAMGSGSIGY